MKDGVRQAARRVVVARIGAAHGVRGEVRLKSFTEDPLAVRAYGPLEAGDGRSFVVAAARLAGGASRDVLVVRFEGVATRNDAEALAGIELSIPRERLPKAEKGEFYHADLIGLAAFMKDGAVLGTVVSVQNFGAGDLLEISPAAGAAFLVPFTRAAVPEIDMEGGRIVVDPPPGLFDRDGEEAS